MKEKTLNILIYTSYACHMYSEVKMVLARVVLSKYSDKVLNVVKAKFDLKDKSEALNKFVELYGDDM